MVAIMQDLNANNFVTAIQKNLSAWIPVFGLLGEAYINGPPGIKRSVTNIPNPLFNSIMDAQLMPGHVDEAIQYIVADARSRTAPLLWWIGPDTRPEDLGQHLEKYGFIRGYDVSGMAIELASLNGNLPEPDGFSVTHAQDDATWGIWCRVMASGFEVPSDAEFFLSAWHNLLHQADPDSILAYIGWLNGKPVATSLLFLAAGVAGIYVVSTIPEARRKGIGALITQYPLLYAHSLGYQAGILQASGMGMRVYRSLGFKEYCRITTYHWLPNNVVTG